MEMLIMIEAAALGVAAVAAGVRSLREIRRGTRLAEGKEAR